MKRGRFGLSIQAAEAHAGERKANQRGCARAGSLRDTQCSNYLPPSASDPFEAFCTSRGIPCFICQQLRLLRGRTLGTAKKQQTQLGCANTAYGFVLASLPTPIPASPSGAPGGGGAGGGEKGGGGGDRRRTNKFSGELFT